MRIPCPSRLRSPMTRRRPSCLGSGRARWVMFKNSDGEHRPRRAKLQEAGSPLGGLGKAKVPTPALWTRPMRGTHL